jgi:hypothetical protein
MFMVWPNSAHKSPKKCLIYYNSLMNRTAATRTSRFELKSNLKSRQGHRGKKEKGMDFLLTWGSSLGALAAGEGRGRWRTRKGQRRQEEVAGLRKNLIYPTVHIKHVTIHSSIFQITGVSSQTVAF